MQRHEESIAQFVERARSQRTWDGVIVEGSVARGTERPRRPSTSTARSSRFERKPDRYLDLAHDVLSRPGPETASVFLNAVESFHAWPRAIEHTLSRYVEDNELAWLTGALPPEYSYLIPASCLCQASSPSTSAR